MKRHFIIILALGAYCIADAQNWVEYKPHPQEQRINSVFFFDSNKGYTVGDGGTILNTLNGGITWNAQNSGTLKTLNSIFFTNPTTGFICGGGWIYTTGCLLKTTNAGLTWNTVSMGNIDPIYSSCFPVQDTGFIVGLFGSIYKTTNSGELWQDHRVDSINFLRSVHFPSAGIGYTIGVAAGSLGGTILKTSDCGLTWNHLTWTTNQLFSVFFINNNIGITVGESGTILKTNDGGVTWNLQTSDLIYPYYLYSVFFPTSAIGYAVGECGTILKSIDGGTTWNSQNSGTGKNLYSVYFIDSKTGFAVGDDGLILSTKNGGDRINERELSKFMKIYPEPANDQVFIELSGLEPKGSLILLTMNGQEVIRTQISRQKTQLDIGQLEKGIYFVMFQNDQILQLGKLLKD